MLCQLTLLLSLLLQLLNRVCLHFRCAYYCYIKLNYSLSEIGEIGRDDLRLKMQLGVVGTKAEYEPLFQTWKELKG